MRAPEQGARRRRRRRRRKGEMRIFE